jgi:hypothetical protein
MVMKSFLIFTFLLVLFSLYMDRKQNTGKKMGGAISPAKSFWLFYCIYTWFLLLPFVLYQGFIPAPLSTVWTAFTGWMIFRGIAELFMMFVTKNWIPPLGIAHNLSCVAWLGTASIYHREAISELPIIVIVFHLSLILSLLMETYYAIQFYKIVGQKTKGEEAVWYANKDDPQFQKVVKITAIFNIPLYLSLIIFTGSLAF